MYKKLLEKNLLCTGCGACVNACPQSAVTYFYHEAEDGSLAAKIDHAQCIHCGQCEEICPLLAEQENKNQAVTECYAVWAQDEIRRASSSGGIFTVLAEYVLSRGGYVCGVAYGSDFRAEHVIISDIKQLHRLRRSKYVQSYVGDVYYKIKKLLNQGDTVLFVGTPCQAAGLKAYAGKHYGNLLMVDIYCNYTPPYPVFYKYLAENYELQNVKQIDFRVKKYGWISDIHNVIYKDGRMEERRAYNDDFQRAYHPKLLMRKTCEQCRFAGSPRQGDLSIADFWHIGEFFPELDDKKGTSCVVVNNTKGRRLFEEVQDKLQMCRKVPLSCMKYNRGETTKAHAGRSRFYQLIKHRSFHEAVDYALNGKYDAVLWGNWSEKNYGSQLTYYALFETIRSLGMEVMMVERPKDAVWAPNEGAVLFAEPPFPQGTLHPLYPDKVSMYELNEKSSIFIVGSDQIWHRNLYNDFGRVAFLDYIFNDKKKIAYASSFGREYWTGDERETQEAAFFLKDFDHISVREKSGVDVCRKYFHVETAWVLDPVFLCPKEKYLALAEKSKQRNGHYIGGYILDPDTCKEQVLRQVQAGLGEEAHIILDAFRETNFEFGTLESETSEYENKITVQKGAYCEDWLRNIIYSDFVVTDSFHGMCFAIMFHKPFAAVVNESRGKVRFTDLLEVLGLQERLVDAAEFDIQKVKRLAKQGIDYGFVDAVLDRERTRSLQWLEHALYEKKRCEMTAYDILLKKMQDGERIAESYGQRLPYIEHELGNRAWDVGVHRKELDEHARLLGERKWDIEVHRKELDERKWDIGVHRKELDERKWDIGVHRKELNEHMERLTELQKELAQLRAELKELQENWIVRLIKKIKRL